MLDKTKKYRLITRADIDGLMCAALLNELNLIDDILFASPEEIQNKKIKIQENDIIANLPYNKEAVINFDHHSSEQIRVANQSNLILDPNAKSVSRVIFNYFGASKTFKQIDWQTINQIDNVKGNGISYNDIKEPKNWVLLSIILDERTGLENYYPTELEYNKFDLCIDFIDNIAQEGIENFLHRKSVIERKLLLSFYSKKFNEQIKRCSKIENNILILDKTSEGKIYPGNRFKVFITTEEEVDYLIHILNHDKETYKLAIRINPLSLMGKVNIGLTVFMLNKNSGGNKISGTLIIKKEELESTIKKLKEVLI